MRWYYRTILFEFAKDGLLGERYINDEEVEATLNEQGGQGWELVSTGVLNDGLLAILKRGSQEEEDTHSLSFKESRQASTKKPAAAPKRGNEAFSVRQLQEEEAQHIRRLEQQRSRVMKEQNKVGDIKIR